MYVQVAADLRELDERRRHGVRPLAKLGRHEREAESREQGLLVGRVGERAERVDERARACRTDELRPEARRRGDDELHGNAVDRDADRVRTLTLDDRHDLR